MDRWRRAHKIVLFYTLFDLASRAQADGDSIVIRGAHFFYKNGSQFFIRGVEYHDYHRVSPSVSSFIDLLADSSVCSRDIPYLVRLGINTLFVSNTDPRLDHSACMRLLRKVGIYVVVTPFNRIGISANNLPTWNQSGDIDFPFDYRFWEYGFSHVDAFHGYANTLGFMIPLSDHFVGRVRQIPWGKAMVRDVKEYIDAKGYRSIPVMTATYQYDMSTVPQYMNCGERGSSADVLALDLTYVEDIKSRCTNVSSWFASGVVDQYRGYSIPTFLLYGCVVQIRKDFNEIQDIFSNIAAKVFSGVVIFGWFDDTVNDFGLIELSGQEVKPRPGYTALSSELAAAQPTSTEMSSYTPTNKLPSLCQNFTSPAFDLDRNSSGLNSSVTVRIATTLPSKPSRRFCACMMETVSCALNQTNLSRPGAPLDEGDICKYNPQWCGGAPDEESTGAYDSFRTCLPLQRGSWEINQMYMATGGNDSAKCRSLGGITHAPDPSAPQASDCLTFLNEASPAGIGTIAFTPTPPISRVAVENTGGSGLSTSAKEGIIGGAVGFFILVFGGMMFLGYLARKRRTEMVSSPMIDGKWQKAELEHIPIAMKEETVGQLDSHQVHELEGDPGEARAVELHGGTTEAELEGDVITAELDGDMSEAKLQGDTIDTDLAAPTQGQKQE